MLQSRREYISPEGLRQDGRRPKELRQLRVKLGVFPSADGSAYLEQGNTKVIVVVSGPSDVCCHLQRIRMLALIVAGDGSAEQLERQEGRSQLRVLAS